MSASSHRSAYVYDGLDPVDGDWDVRLDAGERIGGPVRGRLARFFARSFLLLSVAGGGWAAYTHSDVTSAWISTATALVTSYLDRPSVGAKPDEMSSPRAAEPPPLEQRAEPAPVPGLDRVETRTAEPLVEEAVPTEEPQRLTPPSVEPNNPLQARALGIGLHPGISPAVLAKLTDTDFRHAAHAIKTALADTPDSGTFAWPAKRRPEQALFQVKFVAGAPTGCRRYVVTVIKDNWLTTALPMENCPSGPESR